MKNKSVKEVDDLAFALLNEWLRVDPRNTVSRNPASFLATFADLARLVIARTEPLTAERDALEEALDDVKSVDLYELNRDDGMQKVAYIMRKFTDGSEWVRWSDILAILEDTPQ